jgi:GNAT superfamily N-acetyltransferase
MIPARAEAAFWAGFLRNRNVDGGTALDGAIPVAGGYALYAAGTALDCALGAGTTRPLEADDLAVVEEFYAARAHPAQFELDEAVLARDGALFRDRGYTGGSRTLAVLEGPTAAAGPPPGDGAVAVRTTTDRRAWAALAARALADGPDEADALRRTLQAAAAAAHVLTVASVDGADAGVGALVVFGDLALLCAAGVLPAHRRRGVHAALVAARLEIAHRRGAARAALKTAAGSPVERSAARFGFTQTGSRTRLRRAPS